MLTLADELLYVVCPNPNPNQHGEQQDNIIPAFELPNLSVMSEENGYQMTMIWQPVQGVIGIMEWWTLAIALLFLQCHHEVHLNHEISLNYWMDFHFSGGYICLFWSPEMFSTVVPVSMVPKEWFVMTLWWFKFSQYFGLWPNSCTSHNIPNSLICISWLVLIGRLTLPAGIRMVVDF